ncbi:MAG: lipid-A-disaccharide synthase [Devosia sp.]|uniref:lipid-A-disaccharide synthase n=1 Tax=Devosia sp. TaxID=1871048 RepID=UPI0024C753D2|nr:lipid-A-disaccharide synthase [Devosia sp.]UYO00332.1 MAG: lipid-A-disaccharide synthase [Devosia sp.]
MRLFILAGEPSGDRIAADLVARLKSKIALTLDGVGGAETAGQGLRSLFPMSDLAVMGVTDVIMRLPKLLWRLEQTARHILRTAPDMVVLVDAQDFSRLLAARLRRLGYRGKIVLCVAPSVWARHPERAARIRPLFDAVLAVLPFEPAVMARLGGPPTTYIGHPALGDANPAPQVRDAGPLVLLPGSRDGELRRHMTLLGQIAAAVVDRPEVSGIVLPTLPHLRARLERAVADWDAPVTILDRRQDRTELYRQAIGAVCVSGTVTLELALAGVPMVVLYALDGPQSRIYEKLGRPQVSLPNIILDRPVVPELVEDDPASSHLLPLVTELVGNKKARQDQITAFGELLERMQSGEAPYLREDPADRILAVLRN